MMARCWLNPDMERTYGKGDMDFPSLSLTLASEITRIVFGIPLKSPEPCDVIFIFGGSHPGLWERAAEVYFAGLGKVIIATGGFRLDAKRHFTWKENIGMPEGRVITRELIRLGVPENRIVSENRSTNSLENVLFAKEIYDFSNVSRALLVCKSYGVGRQSRTFQKNIGKPIGIIPYPFDTVIGSNRTVINCDNWMDFEESRNFIITEAAKIYAYGIKGDLQPLTNISEENELLLRQYLELHSMDIF